MPALLVLLAAVCFGTTGTALALGPDDTPALSAGAVRLLIGGGALAALAAAAARRSRASGSPVPRSTAGRREVVAIVAIGALGVAAYQPTFFLGTSTSGIAIGTIVALGSAPVITGVLSWVLQRRYPGHRWSVATAIAIVGVLLLSGVLGADVGAVDPLGVLASLGAGASCAVYAIAAKALLDRGWTPVGSMGALFGAGAVLSLPLLLVSDATWLARPSGIAVALWLGLVTTTLAYVLFARGLTRLPAATAATITLAEPLTAAVLGVAVLGERLPATALAGVLVLAAGLVVLAAPTRTGRTRAVTS